MRSSHVESAAWLGAPAPVSEDMVALIVVAMLTGMTIILSGAPFLALKAFYVLI